jgi:hypothetical protein
MPESNEPQGNSLKISQETSILLPRQQGGYVISKEDFERLKRMAARVVPAMSLYQNVYSVCFGNIPTVILALFGFYSTTGTPTWALNISWIMLVSLPIVGVGFLILERQQKKIIQFSAQDLKDEFSVIESRYSSQNS